MRDRQPQATRIIDLDDELRNESRNDINLGMENGRRFTPIPFKTPSQRILNYIQHGDQTLASEPVRTLNEVHNYRRQSDYSPGLPPQIHPHHSFESPVDKSKISESWRPQLKEVQTVATPKQSRANIPQDPYAPVVYIGKAAERIPHQPFQVAQPEQERGDNQRMIHKSHEPVPIYSRPPDASYNVRRSFTQQHEAGLYRIRDDGDGHFAHRYVPLQSLEHGHDHLRHALYNEHDTEVFRKSRSQDNYNAGSKVFVLPRSPRTRSPYAGERVAIFEDHKHGSNGDGAFPIHERYPRPQVIYAAEYAKPFQPEERDRMTAEKRPVYITSSPPLEEWYA